MFQVRYKLPSPVITGNGRSPEFTWAISVVTGGIMSTSMTPITILEFPDHRLRTRAKPVTAVNGKLITLAHQMLDAMYVAPGIGLAATQVNVHRQLLVLDVSEDKNEPLILINPVITAREGEMETNEGCLSVPGYYEPVTRAENIQLDAVNRDGETFSMEANGLLAVCIQHEIDHLKGKLFVDYLSITKRQIIRKKLLKQQKQRA